MTDYTLEPVAADPFATAAPKSGGMKTEAVAFDPFHEPSTADIVASGAGSGLAQTLGTPADMVAGTANALYGSARGIGNAIAHPLDTLGIGEGAAARDQARQKEIAETPLIHDMPGGAHWWNEKLGQWVPTTETVHPNTASGKFLQQAVRGATAFMAPGILGKALAARGLTGTGEALSALAPGSPAVNAAYGAASGVGGEAAAEMFPDSHAARAVGEMATPIVGAVGAAGVNRAVRAGVDAIPPLTQAGREAASNRAAVAGFDQAAVAPEAASDVLARRLAADEAELVPGSKPTTAELANDPGLLALQRARERLPPDQSGVGNAVREQRIGNNEARVQSLEGMAPAVASPETTQTHLQRHLDDIDAMHAKAIETERQNAETARTAASPTLAPEEQGQLARSAVEAERAPAGAALAADEQGAARGVEATTGALGGKEAIGSTEERATAPALYGAQMRDPVQEAYLAERARLSQMREAIDPTGTMGMRPDAIKTAVKDVADNFHPDTFGGMENKFYDRIAGWGDLIPIEDAFRLRADINARMKNVMDHNPQEGVRLMTVKRGIDTALAEATSDVHAMEQAGVVHQGMAPVAERVETAAPSVGSTVFTPTGRRMESQYEVVDLAGQRAPVVSHDIEGTSNPAYPQELQPRDRQRAASVAQIRHMAGDLQPERLGASASVGEGAPLVGPDNVVESGNGRLIAIRQAYQDNLNSARNYREWLSQQGYDTGNMQMPVLVRRRTSELSDADRLAMVHEANAPTVASMGAAERASGDARKLDHDLLSLYRGSAVSSADNRSFVREFLRRVLSPGEEGQMVTGAGTLSLEGERRIQNALLQRAYGDSRLVAALAEAGDENIRSFGGALADASGSMARLRTEIEAGTAPREMDIASPLAEASQTVATARSKGIPLGDVVAQQDAFSQLSPIAETILRQAYGEKFDKRVSRARLGDYLDRYAEEARRQSVEPDLLGDVVTPERILSAVGEEYGKRKTGQSLGRNRPASSQMLGDRVGENRVEARGPGDGARGPGDAEVGEPPGQAPTADVVSLPKPERQLTPLTQDARERFAEWNRDYAEMARAYRGETAGKLHAVGKILQKGGAYDSFRLADAEVPWIFTNGTGKVGREALEKFLAVAPPEAAAALDDAFAFSLRRAAQREDGTLDLGKYRKWLDTREGALSARPELLDRFNTAARAQERLNDVRQNLAAHDASHPLNPGWGDSGVLRQFWKPGPQGGEAMRRYLEITGNRAEAVKAAEDFAALDFANRSGIVKNGAVDPRAAAAWIGQHQEALSAVPGLKDRFANAAEAQKRVDEAVGRHLEARNDFTKSVAGAFLQDDPDRAIARLFSGSDRTQKARTLMNLVASDKAATEGVQRAAIDHILQKHSGAPMAGAESGTLTPQKLQNFIAENRPVLDVLFPNGAAKNFDALAADLQRSQLSAGAKMPGGSDTAELMQRMGAGKEHDSSIGPITAAVAAEHLGHHLIGGIFGGPAGIIAATVGMRWMKGTQAAVNRLANETLDRMLLDPQFALDMRARVAAKSSAARTAIMHRLAQRAAQSAIQAARSEDLQPPPKAVTRADGGTVKRAAGGSVDAAKHLADMAQALRTDENENSEPQDDARADGGTADPWRTLPAAGQAAHLADTAARIRDEINQQAEAAA